MNTMIRFKKVEIDSNISFGGKKKRTLRYCVRSVALIAKTKSPTGVSDKLPEIFWQ
ncbi:MAG: hypothetical protein NT004_09925 [Bacteroidetes bacterium]|nr:hypothetical protein [Bacteroidota bacterium]